MRSGPTAVIVAAGASRRMGRSKALLPLEGRPLVWHHVARLRAVCETVVVVVGAEAERVAAVLPAGTVTVVNHAWASTGMIASVRTGLRGRSGDCLVTPVDVAPADRATVDALLAGGAPAVPVGPLGEGHPVLLDAALVARLQEEGPDAGLRAWLGAARRVPVSDPWVSADFDEPSAWDRFVAARSG